MEYFAKEYDVAVIGAGHATVWSSESKLSHWETGKTIRVY